jgi:PAS domain S-box-containing protein
VSDRGPSVCLGTHSHRTVTCGELKRVDKRSALALVCLFVVVFATLTPSAAAPETPPPKNVLVMSSFTEGNNFPELKSLKSGLRARLAVPVNFYTEFLDSTRFTDPAYRDSLSETFYHAYSATKLDIVVAAYPALRFALDYRKRVFPDVLIVFVSVAPSRRPGQEMWPGVTGVTIATDVCGSIELALRFHPDPQNIVLIAGVSEFEDYWTDIFREKVHSHHEKLKLIEFVGRATRPILEQVSALPAHTIVFAQKASQDSADPELMVFDLLRALGQCFSTHSVFNYCFNHECLGGFYPDEQEDGRKTVDIAALVLSGEKPESIPPEADTAMRPMVDWRELRRWNIPESLLPLGSIVLYQPAPFWQRYKWSIELAIFFVPALLLLIGSWLFERTQRKRAEKSVALQLRVETLISQISSDLINTPSTQIGTEIRTSLMTLRHFLGVDRISIYKLTDKEGNLRLHHLARGGGRSGAPPLLMRAEFPWLFAHLVGTEPILIPRSEGLPSEAEAELELFRELNLHALAVFPLNVENRLVGVLSFAVIQVSSRNWWEGFLPQLKTLSQVYANAFALELSHEALADSESRFRVLGDATPAFTWMADQTGKVIYLNRKTVDFTGAKPEELNGNGWFDYIHSDDRRMAFDVAAEGLEQHKKFVREYRVKRHDGKYRWMLDVGNPRFNAEGAFVGFIYTAIDVTEQQQAREALESVSGQLIEAQERERSHIARELHDDVCQRLAMLSLRIEKVTKGWTSGKMLVGDQLAQIWQQCSDLTGDVQALSHELHPSILDNLGLVMAVRSFCREFSEETGAAVEFTERDMPASLPRAVSLSLFRVIQEALHNAAKYSGEKHFEVHLRAEAGEIELKVSDRGAGFDVAKVKGAQGLGLVSMYERIHLLNGKIAIESKPGLGTTIRARVPVVVTAQPISLSARAS